MRGAIRCVLVVESIVACVLGPAADGEAQNRIGASHRVALERFLRASRALAVISHSGVPAMISAAAVRDWGFRPGELKVAEIVSDVDGRALEDRIVEIEYQQGTLVALLNDLHKGRHSGAVWSWVIDISAIAIALLCIAGLGILLQAPRYRRGGLALFFAGTVTPWLLFVLFVPGYP